ncbi:MAG: carboxyltransferase domain-containing protein [Paracoccaceae bacterium]
MAHSDNSYPTISNVGLDGLLVTFAPSLSDDANRAALAFRAHIETLSWSEIQESASTLVSAFFRMDLVEHDPDAMKDKMAAELSAREWLDAPLPQGRRRWTIPATFETSAAPQLEEAAKLAGLDPHVAQKELCDHSLRVLTLGFAPGMPYSGYLPENWDIPRQSQLINVPAGALVVAVRQLIIFANPSPTGWRHVGQTAFQCFRPNTDTPVALRPGDEVRLTDVSKAELDRISATDLSGNGGADWELI